jgi:beta-glucosidase
MRDLSRRQFVGLLAAAGVPASAGVRTLAYAGSATSHFQAEPVLYDSQGQPLLASDWDLEVVRRMRGLKSRIPQAGMDRLPRFLARSTAYLDRSAALGENMFRISFDLPRLCPAPGQFNQPLMRAYLETLWRMRARGLEPFLTLHHFTMPRYLVREGPDGAVETGAWENVGVMEYFRFALANLVRSLTDQALLREASQAAGVEPGVRDAVLSQGLVSYFMTFNEPAVTLFNGYLTGGVPPYKKNSPRLFLRVLDRMIEVHDLARALLRDGLRTPLQVGIGHNWQYFDGLFGGTAQAVQAWLTDRLERDGRHSDFLALHYYFRATSPLTGAAARARDWSDQPTFGDVYPAGILPVLRAMHSRYPAKPIFVSEFGFSDRHDRRRPYWMLETVLAVQEALRAGLPIQGLLTWSLVNNFEWDQGMAQKFGMFSEAELDQPLVPPSDRLATWEVWRAATAALRTPSPTALAQLQALRPRALAQYRQAGGRYGG